MYIKSLVLLVAFMALGHTLRAQESKEKVVFKGTADTIYNENYLILYNNRTKDHDSVKVKNGAFEISVPYKGPSRYMFYSKFERMKKGGYAPFGILIDRPGVYQIKADMENFTNSLVTGAVENELYNGFMKAGMPGNQNKQETEQEKLARLEAFTAKYPDRFVSLYLIDNMANGIPLVQLEKLYAKLDSKFKTTATAKNIVAAIEAKNITAIGKPAPDFEQPDTAGKTVKLANYKSKYVLLDFWASWCLPCRAENPNVLKAYNQYKDRGFDVLGISLDQPGKREAWLKAIKQDGLTWTQVSDLKFWDNAVAKLYGIKSLPQNFLLDKKGTIIATDIRGEELQKKLAEIFK
ncbi:MAG: TlpA disulfide reductase family protein [Bacteroidota bacterium]